MKKNNTHTAHMTHTKNNGGSSKMSKKTHAKNNHNNDDETKCRPTTEGDRAITKEINLFGKKKMKKYGNYGKKLNGGSNSNLKCEIARAYYLQ